MKIGMIADTAIGSLGIMKFLQYIIKYLPKYSEIETIYLFYSEPNIPKTLGIKNSKKIRLIKVPLLFSSLSPIISKSFRQIFVFNMLLKHYKLDIVHDIYAFGPYLLKSIDKYKKVVTVHDIAPYLFSDKGLHYTTPSYIGRLNTRLRYKYILQRILKNSDRIIVISKNTKFDLIKHLNVAPQKVEVIYHGVDHELFKPVPQDICEEVLRGKYNIDISRPTILAFDSDRIIDNVQYIIKAFKYVLEETKDAQLLLVGNINRYHMDLAKRLGILDKIVFTGYIPEYDLPIFYSSADLFIHLSLYEGFGFPPVEAMSCGTPVLVSNSSSLKELIPIDELKVSPDVIFNPQELAMKIIILINAKRLLRKYSKILLKYSHKFNWQKTVENLIALYYKVIEGA